MSDFQLFRFSVLPNPQASMSFNRERPRSEILQDIIIRASTVSSVRNWRVHNVEAIEGDGFYLRIGRNSVRAVQTYDNDKGFQDEEFEDAPYTHVVINIPNEVCAIAKKTNLSQNTVTIGKALARILSEVDAARELDAAIEIREITDPTEFISYLETAEAITSFEFTIARPNAFDVNEDIVKPAQKALDELQGQSGSVKFLGESLDAEGLEEITRSMAAQGQEAKARLKMAGSARPIYRSLNQDTAVVSTDEVITSTDKINLLQLVQRKYREIRGRAANNNEQR